MLYNTNNSNGAQTRMKNLEEAFSIYIQKLEETKADHILIYSPVIVEPNIDDFVGIQKATKHQYYELLTKEEESMLQEYSPHEDRFKNIVPEEIVLTSRDESYQIARFVRNTQEREQIANRPLTAKYYIENALRVGPKHIHSMIPPVMPWSRSKYYTSLTYHTVEEIIQEVKDSSWWLERMEECIAKWKDPNFPYLISSKTLEEYNPMLDLIHSMK